MSEPIKPVASAELATIAALRSDADPRLAGAIVAPIVGSMISIVAVIVGAPVLPLAIATGLAVGVLLLLSFRRGLFA